MSERWTSGDAWVFAALPGPGDGAGLAEVVGHADMINHAVLLEAEFTQAVNRLTHAGLMTADAGRYALTEAGRELRARSQRGRGAFGWIEAVPPVLAALGEPRDGGWALPPGAFDEAVRAYLDRAG
ncbi:hypothetical protein [Catellatospora sp. NPDC049609]|uniref:hypothetical protein n=1 Tax=Catellatospora sp. NPDC049609 TaxID=3155505 RepID=UPI0034273BF2